MLYCRSKFPYYLLKFLPFRRYILKNFVNRNKFFNSEVDLKIKNIEESMNIITQKIHSGKPFMLSRYGFTEVRCLFMKSKLKKQDRKVFGHLCNNAGFFPMDVKLIPKFQKIYNISEKNIDILVPLFNSDYKFRERLRIMNYKNIKHLCHDASIGTQIGYSGEINKNSWQSLEYFIKNSWFSALKNKKVLLINPNDQSILSQYNKLSKLHIIPKFQTLNILKTPYTNTYNLINNKYKDFENWFEVLEDLQEQILKIDFDIAILSCGCYGMPLASFIKNLGKQAIHIGGSAQLLFAITGNRWKNEYKKSFPEDFWITPLEAEKPKGFEKIEGGCYW